MPQRHHACYFFDISILLESHDVTYAAISIGKINDQSCCIWYIEDKKILVFLLYQGNKLQKRHKNAEIKLK